MKNLKKTLQQDHSKKTKKELVSLLKTIKKATGSDYENITGLQINELSKTKNADLVAVIQDFSKNYSNKWEKEAASFSTSSSDAEDAGFVAELGSIDFVNIIGGPLNACVTAQNNASLSTVSFIKEVGFDDNNELRMVNFSHERKEVNPDFGKAPFTLPDGTAADVTSEFLPNKVVNLQVPFISLLNVPSIRIETCKINFNAKLNSVYTKDVSSEFEFDSSLGIKTKKVKFDVTVGYKRTSSTGVKVEKEYSLGVEVVASNSEMPGGLERVLGILAG